MTNTKPPGPYLDEIDARIKEAEEWGNEPEAKLARSQREFIKRRWAERMKQAERNEGRSQ